MNIIRLRIPRSPLVQARTRRALVAALFGLVALPAALSAQHAVPLDAQNPRAVRAGAIVERLIAGDRAGAESYLRSNGDSAWITSAKLREELDVLQHLAKKEFRVQTFVKPGPEIIEQFGADAIFVMLASPTVQGEGVLVRVGLEAPYRIRGLTPVNVNRR